MSWPNSRQPRRPYSTIHQWYGLTGKVITETSTAWALANRIVYCPVWVPVPNLRVNGVWIANGTGVAGLVQVGIYLPDSEGKPGAALKRSFLSFQSVTEDYERIPWAPTATEYLSLDRGLYYLALILSSVSSTVIALESTGTNGLGLAAGVFTEDAASTALPAVATPNAAAVNTPVPLMWI